MNVVDYTMIIASYVVANLISAYIVHRLKRQKAHEKVMQVFDGVVDDVLNKVQKNG